MLRFQKEGEENKLSTQTQSVFERVRKICCEQLGVEQDQVTLEARFVDDLKADSLDLVELVMSMEEEFAQGGKTLEITDEEAEKLATVADVVEFLAEKGFKD